jgi:eukaryotic-like serine/threonine-protein kinase
MSGATVPPASSVSSSGSAPRKGDSMRATSVVAPPAEQTFRTMPKMPRPDEPELSGNLGGYEIMQRLGQGGMGSVYLARQVSLDRPVAIKTLAPHLAQDPSFVARFAREAFAAAQLNHHNVVHIHDIGSESDTNFFSMEFVEGTNLGKLVESEGAIESRTAVGYILQAARGLKAAHDQGMIHRDVKPENLLLNDQGIVKVADLGLVKRKGDKDLTSGGGKVAGDTANTGQTQINSSMGTPAYMAPEQAMDAAHVDQRADIYSLGCTMYDLLTGRPPFSGRTAQEVITKHLNQPVPPPEMIVRNLSPELSRIVQKMTAKKPEERYQTMAEVIRELETFLGIDSGNVRASSDSVKIVEYAAERFNAAPASKLRSYLILGFYAACALAAVLCFYLGYTFVASAAVATGVLSTLAYQVTVGLTRRTPVFVKARQYVLGASLLDWLKIVLIAAIVGGLLYLFNQHWVWLGIAFVAAGIGSAFHFACDVLVSKQREKPLQDASKLVKDLRVKGQDEDQIRGFVAKFTGNDWEEFYEALFGYESKIWARSVYGTGERGKPRAKFAAWRDTLIAWLERRLQYRKEAKEQKLLAKLEAKAMVAKGVQENIANKQAKMSAAKMVSRASVVKETIAKRRSAETIAPGKSGKLDASSLTVMKRDAEGNLVGEDEGLEGHKHEGYLKRRFGGPLDIVFGKMPRFIAAAIILAGFAMWWNQNYGDAAKREWDKTRMQQAEDPTETAKRAGGVAKAVIASATDTARPITPLSIKGVPEKLSTAVGSWAGLAAGLVMLLGVFVDGKRATLCAFAGAAIALFGQGMIVSYIPALESFGQYVSIGAGLLVGLGGIFLFRKTRV